MRGWCTYSSSCMVIVVVEITRARVGGCLGVGHHYPSQACGCHWGNWGGSRHISSLAACREGRDVDGMWCGHFWCSCCASGHAHMLLMSYTAITSPPCPIYTPTYNNTTNTYRNGIDVLNNGVGWLLGTDEHTTGSTTATTSTPAAPGRAVVGSLPLPSFQHPGHAVLEGDGYKQQPYSVFRQRALDERQEHGMLCVGDILL